MRLSTDLFEKVWEDQEFIISRGRREGDGLGVLLLVRSPDSPLSANTALLRHAYGGDAGLHGPGANREDEPLY